MRNTLLHIAKLAAVFAFGVCLSSVFNHFIIGPDYYTMDAASVEENADENATTAAEIPLFFPQDADPAADQPATAASQLPIAPASQELSVTAAQGDTLLEALRRGGINAVEASEIASALQNKISTTSIKVGQRMDVSLERSEENPEQLVLKELKIPYLEKTVQVARMEDGKLDVSSEIKPLKKEVVRAGAAIYGSLIGSAEDIGVPSKVMQSIISAYSYDVDFQRDIQAGDRFEVVYESMKDEDGKHVKTGDVLYAQLVLSGTPHRIYYYTDSKGEAAFYTEDGKSVKRALLKTPINGARMSSGFGMRRHPVLGYSKMHRGVDFAAPVGTPIYAAGDGRVAEVGRKGTYGNYLRIRHNGEYSTAYAHLSRFARGLRAGARVKQGQVVAYVGTTGRSTGPHLHFELIRGTTQINPRSVKMMSAGALSKPEMIRFKRQQERLRQTIANLPMQTQVAELR